MTSRRASVNGTKFNNPGNDTIDASAMPAHNDGFVGVVIYGGAGNDTIYGSQGDDQLAGGSGDDTIHARAGNDDVYGDSAFNVNLLLFAQDQITRFDANDAAQLAKINAMFTVPTTPTPGADHLYGDDGADVILGDQASSPRRPARGGSKRQARSSGSKPRARMSAAPTRSRATRATTSSSAASRVT